MLLSELPWEDWGHGFHRADIPEALFHMRDSVYDIYCRVIGFPLVLEYEGLDPITAQSVLFFLTRRGNNEAEEV